MNIKGRFFTLIESLIALSLTLILLSLLSFFYRQINLAYIEGENSQKELFKLRYVENRLSQILPRAVSATTSYKDFYFFTISDPGAIFLQGSPISLIFTYDNGADKNKLFSNHVLGRLFLDAQKRLCLVTWPSPVRWTENSSPPCKLEVLLEDIDALVFEFFVPPDHNWNPKFNGDDPAPSTDPKTDKKNGKKSEPSADPSKVVIKPDREGEWKKEWSQDFKLLPGMVRITVTRKGDKQVYLFPLTETKRQIIYKI